MRLWLQQRAREGNREELLVSLPYRRKTLRRPRSIGEDGLMGKVLVVDDNPAVRTALGVLFDVHGIASDGVDSAEEALAAITNHEIDVVVQDMNFSRDTTSGDEGVELFRAIRKVNPQMPVILLTAWTSLETAVQLIKEGACDYLAKPWDDEKLVASVRTLLEMQDLRRENDLLRAEREASRAALAARFDLCNLVYESDMMHRVVELAANIARADVPVLVTGPNGAGKEVVADLVQANSRRRDRPFLKVNVGGLPGELMESELFGAEAGAFTGATKPRVGRFEAADGGTLFLDEIGNLSPAGQMKLLRVLQNGEFERLGSNVTRKVDVRLVSATNADLCKCIADGSFREDLYYRLNVIEIQLPALSDRPDDILPLAYHFLRAEAEAETAACKGFTQEALRALESYSWPGNVRELRNRIRRARLVAASSLLTPGDLGLHDGAPRERPSTVNGGEKQRIEEALRDSRGVVAKAAETLGLSRQALYRKMDKLGVVIERRPKG